jgi:CXXX repeat modification system protein
MKKLVGEVTPEEKTEILTLFERKNGLAELSKIIDANNTVLYEKLVKDIGETSVKFQQWWSDSSSKYGWESSPDGHWEIDFNTNEIFLLTN